MTVENFVRDVEINNFSDEVETLIYRILNKFGVDAATMALSLAIAAREIE